MGIRPCSVNGIEFDALISESRSLTSEVPEYAVESGFSVSDRYKHKANGGGDHRKSYEYACHMAGFSWHRESGVDSRAA